MYKKKVFISIAGARLVSGNLGCQALALSAMDMLEELITKPWSKTMS